MYFGVPFKRFNSGLQLTVNKPHLGLKYLPPDFDGATCDIVDVVADVANDFDVFLVTVSLVT